MDMEEIVPNSFSQMLGCIMHEEEEERLSY
jgi:hypothetical protein